jgi:peroxidase
MKSIYPSFDDVDLSVGGILEKRVDPTTLTNPTYLCIYMKQFFNTRVGDRYWFERSDPEFAFSPSQLTEIRKSSMSRIFCDNGNNISNMQPNAFVVPSDR